ncbi:uncharacterized protein LOC143919069 isoform X2 [Arctopsyche grandis]|uniref:uncharacterized protein LOC143919069 isoform X2 n=1 Tax=Arctopsyche grandis TaxID=121162 RepID=UPI00406D9297
MGKLGPISGQAITLANSIIGVGILAMPFCFQQCGIILSILLLTLSGFMSRLACHFLLKSAIKSRRRNFEVLAFHVFGNAGKFSVEIGIIGFLMGTCIAYFVVVGDLGPQIIAKIFSMNQSDNLRTGVMVIVSLFCVLPLGLLKNVDSLSNVCAVTIGFYFCLVMKVIAEAAGQTFSGEWMSKVEYWKPDGVLRCLPIFSMSLFCQTQLFEIYDTLPNASLEKMNTVTKNAVSICSVVYVLVGFFGYVAFSSQPISGNILTNLSPTIMSDVIKLGFVMSLAFSFPLIIFPCRASLYSLLYRKGQVAPHDLISNMMPDTRFKYLTVFIIGTTLLISLMLPNIELVLGFVGSTIGVIICVIFPAACFICISLKNTNERILAQIVLCFGIVIMVLGTYANLQAAEIDNISSKYKVEHNIEIMHDQFVNDNKIVKDVHVANFNVKVPEEKDLFHPIVEKVDVKKESRLEPPNPVPPKEDVTTKKVDSREVKVAPLNINVKEEVAVNVMKPDLQTNVSVIKSDSKSKEVKVDVDVKIDSTLKEKNDSNDIKKQNLMETIKRHEKEQREIVQEQQEILKEMKKTKKEMEDENLLKKMEDVGLNSIENKKLAVENIQKLAKLAIESLGGKLDLVTEKAENTQSMKTSKEPPPKVKQIDQVERAPEEVELPKAPKLPDNHVHKEDEPLSYKTGEDAELAKNTIGEMKQTDRANIMKKPPIPVYVLNQAKKVAEKAQVEVNQADKNPVEDNYVGGKRDILEARLEDGVLNDRHKRDVGDCTDELNPDKTLGLKLSLTLSEPETKLNEKPTDEMSGSNSDFIKHQLRHLQWLKEDVVEKR